mgnify:CR=1 FL=1
MPYLDNSTYRPSPIFHNGHISTIYSGILRKFGPPDYDRHKLLLPDGDFLLLDRQIRHPKRAVVLCHGLEGHSRKNYNNVCANFFLEKGYSVFAWNNRSCGGQMNLLPQLYHHASIEDLEFVVHHVIKQGFSEVFLIGFSLGGDQIMNYLGKKMAPDAVKAAVAISAPFQLRSSAEKLQTGFSKIYQRRFIGKVRAKIAAKTIQFPNAVPADTAQHIKNFDDVVSRFIIPVHGGYTNLNDYYLNASPGNAVAGIKLPILVINAWDDPILGKKDHPVAMAKAHDYLFLETPDHGGHCAFPPKGAAHPYSIVRAYEFFDEMV